jgi:hypothetical protein
MGTPVEDSEVQAKLRRFFSNPFFNVSLNILLAIIGILMGFYLGHKTRELAYTVLPARATVVKTAVASRLSVLYDGNELKTDVTAVQIGFWNAGREPIDAGDVLRPLVIETEGGVPILEASIRAQSRTDIVQIKLDESMAGMGRLGVAWHILENDDYGVIQLILAGNPDVKVTARAAIKGQKEISERTYQREQPPLIGPFGKSQRERVIIIIVTSVFASVALFLGVYIGWHVVADTSASMSRSDRRTAGLVVLVILVTSLAFFWIAFHFLFFEGRLIPPFHV